MCWAPELCPETNRLHWQVFLQLVTKKNLKFFKQLDDATGFWAAAHVVITRGTVDRNILYCKGPWPSDEKHPAGKPLNAEFAQIGVFSYQGQRSDLKEVEDSIKCGKSLTEVATLHTSSFIKYHGGIERTMALLRPPAKRDWVTDWVILWGVPRSGKSHDAHGWAIERGWRCYDLCSKWWGDPGCIGYNGQEVVVIDDFEMNDTRVSVRQLKQLADKYPYEVERKNGSANFVAKTLIITSNHPKEDWFPTTSIEDREALWKRVTLEKEYTHPFVGN